MLRIIKSQRFILGLTITAFVSYSIAVMVLGAIRVQQFNDAQRAIIASSSQRNRINRLIIFITEYTEITNRDQLVEIGDIVYADVVIFQRVQNALLTGDSNLRLVPVSQPRAVTSVHLVNSVWHDYRSQILRLLKIVPRTNDRDVIDAALDQVRHSSLIVLATLDDLTQNLETIYDETSAQIQRGILLIGLIAFLFVILGGIPVTWTRLSLRRLLSVAHRFTEGDYTVRANTSTLTEFADIGTAFNKLAETVEHRTHELRDLNQSLELRVLERTAELRATNQELIVATQRATEAARLKNQFLTNISHELRTPLNAIIGFSDMLLMGMNGDLNDKQRHKMLRLKDNGTRLLGLINDLLDLTKIEAGRLELVDAPFSPRILVERCAAQMESIVQASGLDFEVLTAPGVPTTLVGDEKRIEQIIINLLSNAFKFTKVGKVSLQVQAKLDDMLWSIKVADTGIGIPPHALNFIFEEFRQIDGGYARAYKGSGLGLAITRNLVNSMDGKISVESVLEQGSTFTVQLPIRLPGSAPSLTARTAQTEGTAYES